MRKQIARSFFARPVRSDATQLFRSVFQSLAIFSCCSAEALKHFYQVNQSLCVRFSHLFSDS